MVFLAAAKRGVGQGTSWFFLPDMPARRENFLNLVTIRAGSYPDQGDIRKGLPRDSHGRLYMSCT